MGIPRLVYFALVGHGAAGLRHLLERGVRPVLVVTDGRSHPPDPSMTAFNRRRDELLTHFPDLAALCAQEQLPLYLDEPGRPVAELAAAVADAKPDLGLIVTYFRILPPAVFSLPEYGTYNIHPSLLPAYRGPQPVYWALRNGITESGTSLHRLDDGIDTGPVFYQRRVTVTDRDTFTDLYLRLTPAIIGLIDELLAGYITFTDPLPPATEPSFFPLPQTADCLLDPAIHTVRQALNLIRAGNPTMPAFISGDDFRCLLWRAHPVPVWPGASAQSFFVTDERVFLRMTDGLLEITEYDLLSIPQPNTT